ncbi:MULTISPECIES: type II secretion system protein GspM [unclassified Bradyrhizobium]|uniref:type II secretion system protein GspM n=1 Tax=unclassified Bradyrhizobium TaxID=2631580 RepID=UPI0020B41A60|nr:MULTISPECIES: type II secretion system protein GspM [unclassified Bradyrhizobium]MCP3384072.1 type II secretion system protein GspM [Bradyrhizobium sp. CCGUVB4N]MCP3445157.1 type II secretion system protein GspM [Bradyrhizobium sp. CCGUVB14]WFU84442.1 type II secretion system protein GspM [Bradyrhizobium sp. CIAT3101]
MQKIQALLGRFPIAAAAAYLALIALFLFATIGTALDILERRSAVGAAAEILDRLEVRGAERVPAARANVNIPPGSPFLEGNSASLAGAALLQRLAAATKRVSGNTLSSQVDLLGPKSKSGFITATSSLEIDPVQLQPLLYDLEAGMPLLFIDELVIQAPSASTQGGKLRIVLGVSGQRQSQK